MGDGTCHESNNKPMCDYDGWDCLKDCHLPQAIGDGFCDTLTNNEQCVYDGGDCCIEEGIDYMFTFSMFNNCIPDCKFLGYLMIQCIRLILSDPCMMFHMGDGKCDQINNVPECQYDGLDCLETSCKYTNWIQDGVCDDLNNNDVCDFDGGDCCLANPIFEYCAYCDCLSDCK